MEFAFTEEQAMIAETARDFFRENATSERTRKAMAGEGIDRELWQAFGTELGLAGLTVPEEHGGSGLGMVELAIIAEAAGSQVSAIPLLGHAMVCAAVGAGGSDEAKATWLPKLAGGEAICAIASTHSALEAEGDKLTGTIQCVPHGAVADLLLVAAPKGMWLVETAADGVSVEGHTTMDQTRPLATVKLDSAAATPLAQSFDVTMAAWSAGWIVLAAEALGGAQETLERTVAYSLDRVQFGRQIGSFQAYKHRLADMMIEIEQARSAVYWAACAVDEGSDEAQMALHAAKSFCADTYFMCAGNMIQLHGGIGFTWEHDAHLFFKRARSIQTLLMDGEFHREQVARMVLGEAA
ncbi:MAG: acyl-CoA dehydrogenase family protein [Sphingomonadaceae bacterium]